jgi:hypothetical protein
MPLEGDAEVNDADPNHWSSWTDTPPPSSHTEPGVPQAMALAIAELPERFPSDPEPDGLGTTERDATGKMVLHLCDPDCHGASHEEYLTLTEAP